MLRMILPPNPAIERPVCCARLRHDEPDTEVLFHCRGAGTQRTSIRHELSSMGRTVARQSRSRVRAMNLGPKMSGGNQKVSGFSPERAIFNRSLTIPGEIINQLESTKIGEGWCQTS
jgi:hypothetical protein